MGLPEVSERTERKDPLIGVKLGEYVVKHWIGEGGMGVVYLAEQPEIGKAVAIKVLKPEVAEDPEHLKRLIDEARTVNAIHHRGIIDIFGFGDTQHGRQFIVMEYLEGEPLDAHLHRRGRLTPQETVSILDEALSALGAAHMAGVVHRDLKPGNIFLTMQSDGTRYVKVLDFGLAKKALVPYGQAAQTQYRPIGTPEYMAPEQARGDPVGPRTDLYAMGVIAFELLTGDLPFNGPSLVEILIKHMQEPPPHAALVDRSVPQSLDALIVEMLAKKQEDRPPSADAVRQRLKQISRELAEAGTQLRELPPQAERPTLTPLTQPPVRAKLLPAAGSSGEVSNTARVSPTAPDLAPSSRPRRGRWIGAGVGLLVLGAVAGGGWLMRQSAQTKPRVEADPPPPSGVAASPAPALPPLPPPVASKVVVGPRPRPVEVAHVAPPPTHPRPAPAPRSVPRPAVPPPASAPPEAGPSVADLRRQLTAVWRAYDAASTAGTFSDPGLPVVFKSLSEQLEGRPDLEARKDAAKYLEGIERKLPH